MTAYISGSLAYDRIMTFPGRFAECILPDKLHMLNVSFLIDGLTEKRGGCAGNIAYTLALLGEKPLILATAGKDFTEYGNYLKSLGLSMDGIRVMPGEHTASCTLITDRDNNQINGFHPAAMRFSCEFGGKGIDKAGDWGIVSPGNLDDMRGMPRLFREQGIRYIFDPGQQIPALTGEALLEAIEGSSLLVTNDYELEMICKSTGKTRAELRQLTGDIVTTLGEKGSVINDEIQIGIAHAKAVLDPTGAGDAYRSGLLKGLMCGLDLETSTRLGATCASYCIEKQGTQEHHFGREELTKRYTESFGALPPQVWG